MDNGVPGEEEAMKALGLEQFTKNCTVLSSGFTQKNGQNIST